MSRFGMALLLSFLLAIPTKTFAQYTPEQAGWLRTCEPEMQVVVNKTLGGLSDPAAMRERTSRAVIETSQADFADLQDWIARGLRAENPDIVFRFCLAKARVAAGLSPSRSSHTAPAPHPSIAAKPAPPVAANLPKGRPERMAPWSPRAMSIDRTKPLDPKYAAERVDALASCAPAIRQASSFPPTGMVLNNLLIEQVWLSDSDMDDSPAEIAKQVADATRATQGDLTPARRAGLQAGICLYQRRLAQLNGSPLIPGAIDGSLTPLSVGGVTPPWKQQGKDAHTIAGNGKSAMHCVSLETIASGDSNMSGAVARRVLVNHCADEVGFIWCNSPGDCDTETGSAWNLLPGRSWPIAGDGEVRWAACHGRDTASTVRGSYGMRYYCSAPAGKPKG